MVPESGGKIQRWTTDSHTVKIHFMAKFSMAWPCREVEMGAFQGEGAQQKRGMTTHRRGGELQGRQPRWHGLFKRAVTCGGSVVDREMKYNVQAVEGPIEYEE